MKNSLSITNLFKCTQSEFDDYKLKDMVLLECINCKTEYVRSKKNILSNYKRENNLPMFCSKKCFGEHKSNNAKVEKTCTNCNTPIYILKSQLAEKNFCNQSCSAKYNNKTRIKSIKSQIKNSKKCNVNGCENITHNNRSLLCEYHYELKYGLKTKGELICTSSKASAYSHIRSKARTKHKNLLSLGCARCGYDKHVELCHIKGISEFDDTVCESVINDIYNVIQLCPNCHWEFDNLDRSPFHEILVKYNKLIC